VEGYGHKEIAELMGISESTSKTQFLKGKNWLVKRINEQ
jgi:RNA polymerase sigma-70 factor (ECF subfamily)